MTYVVAYVAGLIAFFVIDYIWLTRVALDFYKGEVGSLLLEKPNLGAAALFYLIYVIAIVVLAVSPALEKQQWLIATCYGGLLGFVAYGTYDMTNLATLKGWSVNVAVVDMIWGTVLTASVATIAFFAADYFRG